MTDEKPIDANRTNVGVSITMWITIGVAIITSGFNLYDRSTNIQFENLKTNHEALKTEFTTYKSNAEKERDDLEAKINSQALIIAGYDKDIGHVKETLDRVDKNVSSMNERITNAEIGSAIKKAFDEWRGSNSD